LSKYEERMMKKYLILFWIVSAFSLLLVACGGSGPSTNLSVDMLEFMYNPSDFTVPAGQEITLELSNTGAVVHDFIVMNAGAEVGQDFGEEDEANIYFKAELQPGASDTFTFTAPSQPGEYQVVCGIPGHYTAGMVGKLIVVSQ
jgi:uncharacterized cupredoxin-like copper-binding protein